MKADYENARKLYPSVNMGEAEWVAAFDKNPDIMWAIVGDVYDAVKTEQEKDAGLHRMGRRPARVGTSMEEVYATVFPNQYSMDEFTVSFRKLLNGREQREFAALLRCSQGTVSKLLAGVVKPDMWMMERIAVAARVPPYFFLEYRAQVIGQMVTKILTEQPNMSVTAMKRVRSTRTEP